MVKTVTTAIRVRKRGTSSANFAGRPPKNLPDAHTDELVLKVPPIASNDLLCELGYIHYASDGRIVPPLYQVQKAFHDNFCKAYSALTLDPKTEMYDCLVPQQGRSTVEMDQYDDF